jgi:hypothetical protein
VMAAFDAGKRPALALDRSGKFLAGNLLHTASSRI